MSEREARIKLNEIEADNTGSFLEIDFDLSKYTSLKINIYGGK